MNDLTLYWNRKPGKFVNKRTGEHVTLSSSLSIGPAFTGSVREWYETLVETIIDCRNQLHRAAAKNARQINVSVSPDVLCILESTVLFKPTLDEGTSPKIAGQLCGMNIIKSRSVDRFEIEVEFKTGSSIERGRVIVTED